MDVPRLSTLQALMILLKARESAPKKGYYYRSWMSIVQCLQLAKDLGLDDHFADHQAGRSCGGSPTDCALKTRIWQTLFVVELMIGSPQGTSRRHLTGITLLPLGQVGPTSKSTRIPSTSTSHDRYRTTTSPNTRSHATSPSSPGSFALSAAWRGPTGGSKRAKNGALPPNSSSSIPRSTPG